MSEFPTDSAGTPPDALHNELRRRIESAVSLAQSLPARIRDGDPARDHLGTLEALLTEVRALAAQSGRTWPEPLRAAAGRLSAQLGEALAAARAWVEQAAPQVDALARGERMRRAYRPRRPAP
jgi:hypothetical protein